MIALDTNVLVRALVMDHPDQVVIARRLLRQDAVFISRTVLLETEWVLRARYGKARDELLAFFRALLDAENAVLETPQVLALAVEWYAQGADFADALHLAACGNAVMQTFDRGFCRAARQAGTAPEVRVWET